MAALFAAVFLAGDFCVAATFLLGVLRALAFGAAAFLAGVFFVAVFLAVVFFFAAVFVVFFTAGFLGADAVFGVAAEDEAVDAEGGVFELVAAGAGAVFGAVFCEDEDEESAMKISFFLLMIRPEKQFQNACL